MSLVNLVGNLTDLDSSLLNCLNCGYFHPEMPISSTEATNGFTLLESENPYTNSLNSLLRLGDDLKLTFHKTDLDDKDPNVEEIEQFLQSIKDSTSHLIDKKREVKESIYQHEQAIIQIKHLSGLDANFDEIFACKYVKVRFGRLPYDSFDKLSYYDNKIFFFFPFDHNTEYYWGVYFAPATKIAEIDELFTSLYFERVRVPDYAHGTPEIAINNINILVEKERSELEQIRAEINAIKEKNEQKLNELFSILKVAHTKHDIRKNIATINDHFYSIGFIPKSKESDFQELFADLSSVSCVFRAYDANPTIEPPVKLKNNRFSAPFESFVKLYSLPAYHDMDPTSFVAITYTILFGIMFGDLGQGVLIALIGLFLTKFKKMNFGKILTRIGCSSAIFGILYGSVFGFEDLLNPLYKSVFGLATKPIHVFDTDTTNLLLGGAIGIGILLITISMMINICVGFKTKDYERAVFGNNGIAGLVLYISIVAAVAGPMLFEIKLLSLPYVIFLIVLPVILIFFRHPLGKLVKGRKDFLPESFGEFIIENVFELLEYFLSYLSNSMSFLRVGGFILSHAGMMAVVMSLSEMSGGIASPIVIVIGNLFVMALEGLIVGIQVLRLEFYEIFSRNFEGNGKPFEPLTVSYEIEK